MWKVYVISPADAASALHRAVILTNNSGELFAWLSLTYFYSSFRISYSTPSQIRTHLLKGLAKVYHTIYNSLETCLLCTTNSYHSVIMRTQRYEAKSLLLLLLLFYFTIDNMHVYSLHYYWHQDATSSPSSTASSAAALTNHQHQQTSSVTISLSITFLLFC